MDEAHPDFERLDGRSATTLRQLGLHRAVLHRADGSASWKQEGTEVLAAVYGPVAAAARKEDSEKAIVEVLFRRMAGLPGHQEREVEMIVQRTVEAALLGVLHPRTTVQVVLQVTSDDGAVLACSLNATCFAMIDAGLPMVRVFMAVSAAITSDGEVLIDPTREEEEAAEARVCVALEGNAKRPGPAGDLASEAMIITSWSSGRLTQEMFFHVVGLCRKAQAVMEGFARKSLEQYYDRKTTP